MILLIGQVGRGMMGREAFQEIDYGHMFGPMAKWVAQIDSADRIPELVARAFHVATAGRPGPVVLALPEDMLVEQSDAADAEPYSITRVHPAARDVERAENVLEQAERPLVIVGGAPWSAEAHAALTAWSNAGALPVAAGWRCQDFVDNTSETYVGHLGPRARPSTRAARAGRRRPARDRRPAERDHDLGLHHPRGSEPGTGAHPRERRSGRARARLPPALAIVASPDAFAIALADSRLSIQRRGRPRRRRRKREYHDNLRHRPAPGTLDMGEVMAIFVRTAS